MNTSATGPQPVYAVIYGSFLAVGLPLNALSLWILLRRHSLNTPSAVFMVNLAFSDLLLAITLPMRIYFYATGTWQLGEVACNLTTILFCNNMRSSIFFITFISMDRLMAVVYPLRSRLLRTSRNAWKVAVLTWSFVTVVSIPESRSLSRVLSERSEPVCFEFDHYSHHCMVPILYFRVVVMFTMLAVNIVCTALVSLTLHKHLSESARVNNKVNVMLIFVMNLVVFIICFLPVTIGLLQKISSESSFKITALTCLATVNCCLDPLLYYFSLDAFWKKKQDVDLPGEGS